MYKPVERKPAYMAEEQKAKEKKSIRKNRIWVKC